MYHQIVGTAMGSIFAPPYACLTIGFLEETILFPSLASQLANEVYDCIIDRFFRFMDDGITLLPAEVDENLILNLLNRMHPAIRYTIEKAEEEISQDIRVQSIVFLSLKLFIDSEGNTWTDVYYKDTNTHEYLNYESHHPEHIKNNIPYVLAKRIMVFTTKDNAMRKNLGDLEKWLKDCGYPENVIKKGVKNASLQGPAPERKKAPIIPLVSTYYSNYSNEIVLNVASQLIKNSKNTRIKKAFENVTFMQAFRQPANLIRSLSHSEFRLNNVREIGVFKCNDKRCKVCTYIQEGTQILMSNGVMWETRCYANCNSHNVLYFLLCNFCYYDSYIGKTDIIRERTNNHISCCRHGTGTDKFDRHVHECAKSKGMPLIEPFFKLHIMLVSRHYSNLLDYESKYHALNYDTLNRRN